MRIQVRRTGGFAGIERRAEVDTSALSDTGDWHVLAEEALATADASPPAGAPDGFSYQLTVDDRSVYCADPKLTASQRTLIRRVLREGTRP